MANDDTIREIRNLAQTWSEPGVPWTFLPLGNILLKGEDKGMLFGGAFYKNPLFEYGPSLKIYDWMFAMERKPAVLSTLIGATGPTPWFICAFNGERHYTFVRVDNVEDAALPNALVLYVVKIFWKRLYPGTPFPGEDEYMALQISTKKFAKEIIIQNVNTLRRAGFNIPG